MDVLIAIIIAVNLQSLLLYFLDLCLVHVDALKTNPICIHLSCARYSERLHYLYMVAKLISLPSFTMTC